MSQFLNPGVSIDLSNSWAGRSLQQALRQTERDPYMTRNYNPYQARFQQRQMQEKEEKLLRLYENQQQRAFEKVSRSSSGGSSISGGTSPVSLAATMGSTGAGRVRQLFEERRQKAGIDRSYPLEPLKQTTRLNGHAQANRVSSLDRTSTMTKSPASRNTTAVKGSVQRTVSQSLPGKPAKSRTIKQNFNSTYSNGRLLEENSSFEKHNNDFSNSFKQQRDLETMMNNHNLRDHLELDHEEMPNLGIDEVDEGRDGSYSPNENDYYTEKKRVSNTNGNSNGNSRHENDSSAGSTPTKAVTNASKQTAPIKKVAAGTPSNVKPTTKTPEIAKRSSKMSLAGRSTATTIKSKASGRQPLRSPAPSSVVNDNLVCCQYCQRRFATDRIQKHQEICARTLKKQRKIYDAVRHRVQGTEVEIYAKKGPKGTSVRIKKPPQMPKTDWRRQHEEFISAIRAAKTVQAHVAAGGKLADLPPPPPSLNPDYVQCPHCGRRFNEAAAERHIPKCASMLHNKPNRLGKK